MVSAVVDRGNGGPEPFISTFVTVDETWLHHFDPESKAQSMAWKHVTSLYLSESFA